MRRGLGNVLRGTVLAGAVAGLVACGGGGTTGAPSQASAPPRPSAAVGSTSAAPSSTGSGSPSTTVPAIPVAADVVVSTPSGNILCWGSEDSVADPGTVLCLVGEHDYPIPDCETQPGATFAVAGDDPRGSLSGCASDLFTQPPVPVAYGDTLRLGPAVCDVAETGVTCTTEEGHGFWISRRDYRLF